MIYRTLGRTGKRVSAIGFGGMRFKDIHNRDACCETLERAVALGINYFDAAPDYCAGKSEERLGEGLHGKDVLISTKSGAETGSDLRRDLETSLKKLRRQRLDVFHIWYVLSMDDYRQRQKGGAIRAALKAKEEGLVGEVFVSTHMDGSDIQHVLEDGYFSGVTLGFSPINAPFRLPAIEAARRGGLAVVCMNPLGGGIIPKHADHFSFLQRPEDRNVIEAALRYILSTAGVTLALVGCADARQVDMAVAAVDPFIPWPPPRMASMHKTLSHELNRLCTGCLYCKECPADIHIAKLMLTYNLKLLGEDDSALRDSMANEWGLSLSHAAQCTACGHCEDRCTQKLPIIERLKYIAGL